MQIIDSGRRQISSNRGQINQTISKDTGPNRLSFPPTMNGSAIKSVSPISSVRINREDTGTFQKSGLVVSNQLSSEKQHPFMRTYNVGSPGVSNQLSVSPIKYYVRRESLESQSQPQPSPLRVQQSTTISNIPKILVPQYSNMASTLQKDQIPSSELKSQNIQHTILNNTRTLTPNRPIPQGYWNSSDIKQNSGSQAFSRVNNPPLMHVSKNLDNTEFQKHKIPQTSIQTESEDRILSKPSLFFNKSPQSAEKTTNMPAQNHEFSRQDPVLKIIPIETKNSQILPSLPNSTPQSVGESVVDHRVPSLTYDSRSSADFPSVKKPEDFSFNSKQQNNVLFKRLQLLNLDAQDKPPIPKSPTHTHSNLRKTDIEAEPSSSQRYNPTLTSQSKTPVKNLVLFPPEKVKENQNPFFGEQKTSKKKYQPLTKPQGFEGIYQHMRQDTNSFADKITEENTGRFGYNNSKESKDSKRGSKSSDLGSEWLSSGPSHNDTNHSNLDFEKKVELKGGIEYSFR